MLTIGAFWMTLWRPTKCFEKVEPVVQGEELVWQKEGPVEQEEEPSLISFHSTDVFIFNIFFTVNQNQ